MAKKSLHIIALMLCLFTISTACACGAKLVGEERAKQSGLALLRQAFGVTAKDAHVEYFERAGTSVVDNAEVHPGENTRLYLVTISDDTIGVDLYYAEVDAITGVAYYATKNEFLLAPASAQDANDSETTEENKSLQEDNAKSAACDFVMRRFQKEVALISPQGCCGKGGERGLCASIGYFVTFADGALYRVGFTWPAMDLNEVQVLDTKPEGERP
jgi:hypothetical protein